MHRPTLNTLLILPAALLLFPASRPVSAQTYKTVAEYKLPGSGVGGLAVDASSRRLFVTTSEGIAVLDADTGAQLGLVPLKGSQSVLVIPVPEPESDADESTDQKGSAQKKVQEANPSMGFATAENRIVSFSLTTLKLEDAGKLPTGGASSLCFDEEDRTVEAISQGGSIATINSTSGKLLHTTRLQTGIGEAACGILHHVYVADGAANVVHVLNYETGRNDGDLPMRSGHKPSGLTLDTKGRRLFVTCEDGVIEVIDTDSGFTFIQLKASAGPASETFAWTPQGKGQWKAAAFIAQPDGTLTAVRMNAFINYSIGGSYALGPGLRSVTYDEKTHHLLLTAMHAGSPVVVVAGY